MKPHRTLLASRAFALAATILLLTAGAFSSAHAQLVGGTAYPINGTESPPTSFGSIASSVAYMTANNVTGSGQVILELSTGYAGEAGPVTIGPITGTGPTLGVTFRPASGYTALTSVAGAASPNQFAIKITGSYITLDGRAGGAGSNRDWTIRCTGSTNGQSAVRVDDTSGSLTDVAVRYCVLEAEATGTTSAIVATAGNTTNTLQNLVVERNLIRSGATLRGYGILTTGASNAGNTGLVIRDNTINQFGVRGINLTSSFPGALVYGNDISHTAAVTQTTTAEFSGIYFSSTASGGTLIYDNFIHDIQLTNGSTAVNGIYCFNGNTSGARIRIYNNRVAIGAGVQPTTVAIYGIRDNSVTNALFDVQYNSVYIGGSPAAGTANSAAYRKDVNSAVDLRNNVFYNARSNSGATGTHWGISINAASSTNATAIDYNDYYASGTGGVLGTTTNSSAGNQLTLAAWKAAVPADVASVSEDPDFVNPTAAPPDLKINTALATQLESGGIAIAGIDDDFEGSIRQGSPGYAGAGTAPDMGADEFEGTAADFTAPSISYALLPNSMSTTTVSFPGVTVTDASGVDGTAGTRPRVYYKKSTNANAWNDNTSGSDGWKFAEASGSTSPFDFTIDYSILSGGSASAGDTIQYFAVAQDLATTPNVGINAGTFASAPASVALTAAAFPIGGSINSYLIVGTISGAKTVGAGGDFATLKAAFDAVNANVVNGDLDFTVLSSGTTETASAVLNAVVYSGGPWTITVKPAAFATPAITGSVAGALVKLAGADNVVFDGSNTVGGTSRDLTISNTSTSGGSAAIWLSSQGAGAGCSNVTVENTNLLCGVDQSTSTNETFAVVSSGSSISTTSDGADNDNNTFVNNAITKVRWGIYLRGASGDPNAGATVSENVIGPSAFGSDQIGKGGIVLRHQDGATVSGNEVGFVGIIQGQSAGGSDRVGIGLGDGGWTVSATAVTNTVVTKNLVHDIIDEKTFAAVGIVVAGSGAPSGNTIANNMIYNVRANGTASDQGIGIGIADGGGDIVAYNSISLTGDIDPGGSSNATQSVAGIRITATPANLTLKNNVVSVDVSSNTGTLRHFAIVAPSTSYAWGSGGADNNDYFVNPSNPQMVLGGIGTSVPYTNVTSLADWRTQFTPNQDGASVSASPPFVSATDLHLQTSFPTALESGGAPIAGVADDFDGQARNALTPDIGADEGTFTALFQDDIRAAAFIEPADGGSAIQGAAFAPQATFENVGILDETNVKVRFRIVGPSPATTEVYNDSTTVDTLAVGAGVTAVSFSNVTLSTTGTYTMYASSELPTDDNTSNDSITGTFSVLAPLAGTYVIGAGETAPFNTLTSAVNLLNQVGVSAAVVFSLADTLYTSPAETFPISIAAFPGAGPTTGLKIEPAAGGSAHISGSSTSAIVKLNGADYVTIEGVAGAKAASRDLTISNASGAGGSAAVWLSSLGAGAGASNNTVQNCRLLCGADQSAVTTETFALISSGAAISATSDGEDNDNNAFINNEVLRARWGIYLRGASANQNDGIQALRNLVGPAAFGSDQIGKGGIILQHQDGASVSENEVRFVGLVLPQAASGSDRVGIGIGTNTWTPSSTSVSNTTVTRNLVHDIVDEKTFSAAGIALAGSGSPSGNVVANNMVYNVRANGTAGDQAIGLGVGAGDGDRVVHNSVLMTGDMDPGASTTSSVSAAGIRVSAATVANLTLKDNISSVDVTSNTATLKHYAIVIPSATYAWGTGGSNVNDLFVNAANTQMALGGAGTSVPYTAYADLAAWQAATGQDSSSVSADPLFTGASDLHIVNAGPAVSPVANAGTPIAGVTDDFDGGGRSPTAPDIGADEFTTFTLTVNVVGGGSVTRDPDSPSYNPATVVELTAVPASGSTFVQWTGDLTGSANPDSLTMDADKNVTATFEGLTIAVADASVGEGDTGTADAAFVLTLSAASTDTVKVDYQTANGTAIAGQDYVAASGQSVFEPGTTTDTLLVAVNGDLLDEDDETFAVDFSNPVNAGLPDTLAAGTILDDDAPPAVSIGDVALAEGNAGPVNFVFSVTLSAASGKTVSVLYATADSSAQAGTDYTAISPPDTLVFAPGDTLTKTVTVVVSGDTDFETDEVFFVNLSGPSNVTVADGQGRGVILNDDTSVGVESAIPVRTFLGLSYPNPFSGRATIPFGLKESGRVSIRIFDVRGRLVRDLASGLVERGYRRADWDGRDQNGARAASGVYILRMETGGKTFTQTLKLIR